MVHNGSEFGGGVGRFRSPKTLLQQTATVQTGTSMCYVAVAYPKRAYGTRKTPHRADAGSFVRMSLGGGSARREGSFVGGVSASLRYTLTVADSTGILVSRGKGPRRESGSRYVRVSAVLDEPQCDGEAALEIPGVLDLVADVCGRVPNVHP